MTTETRHREIIRKICPLSTDPLLTAIVPTKRRRNPPTPFLPVLLSRCSATNSDNARYLRLGTYMFTLDTDSLKTLGFNPRTPTLRLRPMTSWPFKYFPRHPSFASSSHLLRVFFASPSLYRASFLPWTACHGTVTHSSGILRQCHRFVIPIGSWILAYALSPLAGCMHVHPIQHCSIDVYCYINTRRETQFRAGGIRFFK